MGKSVEYQVDALRTLFAEKLRVQGRDLEAQVRKAGRRLPRHVRRDARFFLESYGLMANPKLARMVDGKKMDRAYSNIVAYLDGLDPRQERITAMINLAASIAFVFLVTGVLVLVVLVLRGFV
ncbi:hypothetical protein SLH49_09315 [Cognatiyoonia sp. IB215446]|uniref:hypothetical protein n=1 Tax=Cognatiyoonia sp. IB215446 TaxID=3097355 RepID=UPI002A0E07BA|nr:hypothetical protein [Cognatiyoonia sp. IB215446]MDX8348185.1 hypothetical protein [Cognatiyoonia sp. IB215446]